MSNYPPMTKEDWKHIDGETHYRECPMHEDNLTHRCLEARIDDIAPEYNKDAGRWEVPIHFLADTWWGIRVRFCPYCSEELEEPVCRCTAIAEDEAAEAAERRAEKS